MRYVFQAGGKNMKSKILTKSVIIVAILTLTGLASGSGCNDRSSLGSHLQTYDYLSTGTTDDGNKVTYFLNTVNKPGASVIGYCVYPTPGFTGDDSNIIPLFTGNIGLWAIFHPKSKDYFGFERRSGGNKNNIPVNGNTGIQVGKVDYLSSDKKPSSEVILFHINDIDECGPIDETCWRRPGTPVPPVPELTSIVLVSAGLFGLFMVSRMYAKK